MRYLLPLLILFVACQNKEASSAITEAPAADTITKPAPVPEPGKQSSPLQQKMLGVWANTANPDGIFDITDSTFYYAHNYEEYRYQLQDNVLTIHYPNATYTGKASFNGDTLVLASDEGTAKYWRYKGQ